MVLLGLFSKIFKIYAVVDVFIYNHIVKSFAPRHLRRVICVMSHASRHLRRVTCVTSFASHHVKSHLDKIYHLDKIHHLDRKTPPKYRGNHLERSHLLSRGHHLDRGHLHNIGHHLERSPAETYRTTLGREKCMHKL